MRAVFEFWQTRDKSCLLPFVPPSIYEQIEPRGTFIDGLNKIITDIQAKGTAIPNDFLTLR